MNKIVKGIYFHIPFCHTICNYCDFAKGFYDSKIADLYLIKLAQEFKSYHINPLVIESIYIGGGSPSSLSISQLEYLLEIIFSYEYPC
ncbi:MAG: radical SAM family heme chaperone HemW, partial [Bacilli bacterium]